MGNIDISSLFSSSINESYLYIIHCKKKYFPNITIREIIFNIKYNNDKTFIKLYNTAIHDYPKFKMYIESMINMDDLEK